MKLTTNQQAIIKAKVQELAPHCEVKITTRALKSSWGHIKIQGLFNRVIEYRIYNGVALNAAVEYDDEGRETGGQFIYQYSPLKTALHEYGHMVQHANGLTNSRHYDINEITTEFVALKLMKKYFPELLSLETENASRAYIRQYYDHWSRTREAKNWAESELEKVFDESVAIIMPAVEEFAKAIKES